MMCRPDTQTERGSNMNKKNIFFMDCELKVQKYHFLIDITLIFAASI